MEASVHMASLSSITWRTRMRAVLAITRKDWLLFVRYPLNAVFRVVQPIMWLTPIYFLSRSFGGNAGNTGFAAYAGTVDFMSFVLIGKNFGDYVSAVFWGMGFALKQEMDSGVLETNWLTPVPRPLFLVGQTLASLVITTFTSAGVLVLAWFFFGFRVTGNLVPALLIMVPTLIALYGFGFAFAGLVLLLRDANTLVDVSDFVVRLLSGAQFPVRVLPPVLLAVSLVLPLTYGYDAIRGLLLGIPTILPIRTEVALLVGFMGVMVAVGYVVFKLVERRCRTLGTLGLH